MLNITFYLLNNYYCSCLDFNLFNLYNLFWFIAFETVNVNKKKQSIKPLLFVSDYLTIFTNCLWLLKLMKYYLVILETTQWMNYLEQYFVIIVKLLPPWLH